MDPIVNILSVIAGPLSRCLLLAAIFTKRTVYRESRAQRLRYMIPIMVSKKKSCANNSPINTSLIGNE
jgi:hypothetical protein